MARTKSTDHLLPDIHDEGLIKRYGFAIAIGVGVILLLLFVVWTTMTGWQNQFGPNGPSAPAQSGRS